MVDISHDGFVDHLRREASRLREAAPLERLDAPVPSCPGWTVRDLVEHTADVYRHKALILRAADRVPWPPERGDRATLEHFDAALDEVLSELTTRDPSVRTWTWDAFDRSVGFWSRRMAQETLVHRFDAELATRGAVGEVDEELAVDGVDEVLVRFVAGDWSDERVPDAAGTVVGVRTGGHLWRTVLDTSAVVTLPDPPFDEAYDGVVEGSPRDVLLWLWGRGPIDPLTVDPATDEARSAVDALRARLAIATQ